MARARVGPYELRGELARGGAGVVHRAWDPGLGREVALKLLKRGGDAGDSERRRFRREAEALARIRHRNVVRVHAAGDDDGRPYLVMELVEGETLQARLDREGRFPWREAADLARRLAEGLAAAHRAGVLHRDIKPDNVLLSRGTREPLLTDFGLAKDLSATQSRSRLSIRGRFLGTPGYWPPEQARGELEAMGPRSDVYALGATLWALLVGRPPFDSDSLVEALVAAQEAAAEPPSRHAPEVPMGLDRVALACLEKDPARRYPGAEALAQDLERVLRGEPPSGPGAAPAGGLPAPRVEPPPRANPAAYLSVAAGALLLLAAGSLASLVWPPEGAPAPPERPVSPSGPAPKGAAPVGPVAPLPADAAGPDPDARRVRAALAAAPPSAAARLEALEALLTAEPGLIPARWERARHLARAARSGAAAEEAQALADALARAREVAAAAPGQAEAWLVVAELAGEGEAQDALRKAAAGTPRSAASHARARLARAMHDLPNLSRELSLALALDPEQPAAWLLGAEMAAEQGDLALQVRSARRALALDPLQVRAPILWADALLEGTRIRQDAPEAGEALEQALRHAPRHPDLLASRARLALARRVGLVEPDQPAEARVVADAAQALGLAPDALRPMLAQAEAFLLQGRTADAAAAAAAAAVGHPRSFQAQLVLAATTRGSTQATTALLAALERAGLRERATRAYLRTLVAEGRRLAGDALGAYQDALLASEEDPSCAPAHLETGRALLLAWEARRGPQDLSGAVAAFTGALERDPQLAEAALARAGAFLAQGDSAAALRDLDRAEALLARGARLDRHALRWQRGAALHGARRWEEAEEALAGFLQQAPAGHPQAPAARALLEEVDRHLRAAPAPGTGGG